MKLRPNLSSDFLLLNLKNLSAFCCFMSIYNTFAVTHTQLSLYLQIPQKALIFPQGDKAVILTSVGRPESFCCCYNKKEQCTLFCSVYLEVSKPLPPRSERKLLETGLLDPFTCHIFVVGPLGPHLVMLVWRYSWGADGPGD